MPQVLHSALHPHVIKIMETFASADDMLDHFHRHYEGYLEGVFDFRAAVNPTVHAYTPLDASLRPCLSAMCVLAVMDMETVSYTHLTLPTIYSV